ncbi:hypothetical protein SASPL_113804 [Salvia splendens]|uniref:Uncharacterized protein n=1 Tax=Salvia splendens TaxID=180675 RepID=A0A8X8Y284_SALSN|nr:hypothetical protein SASPL_113804 [Salvia splendens]
MILMTYMLSDGGYRTTFSMETTMVTKLVPVGCGNYEVVNTMTAAKKGTNFVATRTAHPEGMGCHLLPPSSLLSRAAASSSPQPLLPVIFFLHKALKEALAHIRACSRLEALLLKKKAIKCGDTAEIHSLKVLT